MPLVIPQVSQGDKGEWLNKLAGKKISENTSDVNVRWSFLLNKILDTDWI